MNARTLAVTGISLLALLSVAGCGRREPANQAAPAAATEPGWFTEITDDERLAFRHSAGAGGGYLMTEIMGSGAALFDYDRDGALDLYVATYVDFDPSKSCSDRAGNPEFCGPEAFRGLPDRLFRGRGGGSFEDVTARALPGQPANKGLGVVCADLDGDSRVDVYVANDGEANQLWINRGPGSDGVVTFEDRALGMGAAYDAFGRPEASMGVTARDVDGDGDLDLLETTCGGPARLYRNDAPRGGAGNWLRVRAVDPALRRDALGATVEVRAGRRRLVRPLVSAQSYLTAVEPEVHFGLGSATRASRTSVRWPGGAVQVFENLLGGRYYRLREGGEPVPLR